MSKVAVMPFRELLDLPRDATELWVTPSVRFRVTEVLPYRVGEPANPAHGTECVISVGGGVLLDTAKAWRADQSPATRLVAVPSIWGSGAEVSPIVVLNKDGKKVIRMDDRFLPDRAVYWPELAESVPDEIALEGCGDAWTHALEAFLSPIAEESLREEIADLMGRMLGRGIANDSGWFQLSADACLAQARSSVGLVHGIAHTLEGPLRAEVPSARWGHARLCSVFLWPVMAFNLEGGGKATRTFGQHNVDLGRVFRLAGELHDYRAYQEALPLLTEHWRIVLREQGTRTNVRLVRPRDLAFFEAWSPS